MHLENEEVQLLVQRLLGQILFYPPNVAGWPGGKNWIDSSSLMFRLRLPQLILEDENIDLSPKTDDDQQMGMREEKSGETQTRPVRNANRLMKQHIVANINWDPYVNNFSKVPKEKLIKEIAGALLQTSSCVSEPLLQKQGDVSSRTGFIKSVTIALMATPEYQLC